MSQSPYVSLKECVVFSLESYIWVKDSKNQTLENVCVTKQTGNQHATWRRGDKRGRAWPPRCKWSHWIPAASGGGKRSPIQFPLNWLEATIASIWKGFFRSFFNIYVKSFFSSQNWFKVRIWSTFLNTIVKTRIMVRSTASLISGLPFFQLNLPASLGLAGRYQLNSLTLMDLIGVYKCITTASQEYIFPLENFWTKQNFFHIHQYRRGGDIKQTSKQKKKTQLVWHWKKWYFLEFFEKLKHWYFAWVLNVENEKGFLFFFIFYGKMLGKLVKNRGNS